MSFLEKLREKWKGGAANLMTETPVASIETPEVAASAEAIEAADTLAKENAELHAKLQALEAEKAKADADAKAREEEVRAKAEADRLASVAAAEKERKARIESDVKAFEAKCVNAGKEATTALVSRYRAALEANDEKAAKDFDVIASSFVAPSGERAAEGGPSADDIASRAKMSEGDIGVEAAKRTKAKGIQPKSPKWAAAYQAAVTEIRKELNNAA